MAYTALVPAGADTAGFRPEIWSKQVIDVMQMNLVAMQVCDLSFKKDLKYGDTINVPILNEPSVTEVTVGTRSVNQDVMTGTKLQIVIDQWHDCNIPIGEDVDLMAQVDVMKECSTLAAYAIKKKVDQTVCALFSALSGGTGYGTDGVAVTDTVLIAAVEELDEADVPEENRSWVFDPSVKADLLKQDIFIRNDYVRNPVIPTGQFGTILNSPVFTTNNLTANSSGNYGAYLHKKAIACVLAENPVSRTVAMPLEHQTIIQSQAIWGVKEMRDTFGCPILTRNA